MDTGSPIGDPWTLGAVRLRDVGVGDDDLIAMLNEATGGGYELVHRFPAGEFGAWLVRDRDGDRFVLKCRFAVDWRPRITALAEIVGTLIARGHPAPPVLRWGYEPTVGTWYLLRYLSGETPTHLSPRVAEDVCAVVDLQADHRLEAYERSRFFDWSDHITQTIVHDRSWLEIALQHSAETARLAGELAVALQEHAADVPAATDFVHGDLLASQLLVRDDRLSGVIDWEQAGIGNRGQDLSLLFLNAHAQASRHGVAPDPGVLAMLISHAVEAAGVGGVAIFLAYEILSMVSFVIQRNPRHIGWRTELGHDVWRRFRRETT